MFEVNIVKAVMIQKKIQEEVTFLINSINEAPKGLCADFQILLDKRTEELNSIDTGIEKVTLLIPNTTSRFVEVSPNIIKEDIIEAKIL
jgi:hypothetical protein